MADWPLCQTDPMPNEPPEIRCVAWSPDGGCVWAPTQDGQLLLCDAVTGARLTLRRSQS